MLRLLWYPCVLAAPSFSLLPISSFHCPNSDTGITTSVPPRGRGAEASAALHTANAVCSRWTIRDNEPTAFSVLWVQIYYM